VAENRYYASNPPDWTDSWARVRVERAADVAGVPSGTWTEIANVAIDTKHEYTKYVDAAGIATDWYRHHWSDVGGGTVSDNSDAIQAGDSPMRQNAIVDMAADDITTATWSNWLDESVRDLYALGVWYPARATITAIANTEYYPLDQRIRDAFAVELVDTTYLNHIEWLILGSEWEQMAGELRLYNVSTSYKYVVHGKAQFKDLGELTDDYFSLILAMAKVKYYHKRLDERMDFIAYMVGDPRTDVNPDQIRQAIQLKEQDVARQLAGVVLAEPAKEWPSAWGGTA